MLIVDDSQACRQELASLLSSEPHIQLVGMAKHGLEAMTLAGRHKPDIVLLDQNMPVFSGVEVARRIKSVLPKTRVFFVAAESEAREQAMAAGAEAFFVKGVDTVELLEALREAHSPRPTAIRSLKLPRKKKAPPKIVPWLGAALRLSAIALLAGILLSHGKLLTYIALLSGILFFAYAMKYYVSMAMIMAASGGNGNGANGRFNGNGFKNGNGLNGLKNGKRLNGLRNGHGLRNGNGNGNGNGAKERLKVQPFVSIQLPLFNEKTVVDRLLTACTSLDYENYEIIVADDSSDETINRLEKWAKHPKVRVLHRINRSGFKGAALHHAMEIMNPQTEFLAVFDADFVPPPQIIWQFLDYFYGYKEKNGNGNGNGNKNEESPELMDERVGVVQGYQWHMLNADENWITKGVRAEYSGSYVIERSGQELLGGMKMISGSVYMIRADVLREIGWGTSITEDWELTLKLYLHGYKVLYTPFIQAPSECVSTFGHLVKQRMRWAEGHTYNVRKYFMKVMTSSKISRREKLEFIYFAPYYLQSIFFTIGTVAWFFSETILHHEIPYWTSLLGWSLVFSNMGALVLMNLSGLFMERGVKKEWTGVLSAVAYGTLLVPFQAYAALKGLLEVEEGGWFRTPKTGIITKVIDKLSLGGKMGWLQPKKRKRPSRLAAGKLAQATGIAVLLSQPGKLINTLIGLMIVGVLALISLSPLVQVAEAAPDVFNLHTNSTMDGSTGSPGSQLFDDAADDFTWASVLSYPEGGDPGEIASGNYILTTYFTVGVDQNNAKISLEFSLTYGATTIGTVTTNFKGNTASPQPINIAIGYPLLTLDENPAQPLRLRIRFVSNTNGQTLTLLMDDPGSGGQTVLNTPAIVVPEYAAVLVPFAVLLPPFLFWRMKRRKLGRSEVRIHE